MNQAGSSRARVKTKTPENPEPSGRSQIIQEKKQQMFNLPREKKILKLAICSSCNECKCEGWKPAPAEKTLSMVTQSDPCLECKHTLALHTTQLNSLSDEEINRLLNMFVDVECLYATLRWEQDEDNKRIYNILVEVLRNCIVEMKKPVIEVPFGQPPFELPNISTGVMNFVLYKYSHIAASDRLIMNEMAKIFLQCFNHNAFETPSSRRQSNEVIADYKKNYSRWLVFCYAPRLYSSFTYYDPTSVFGLKMLQHVFRPLKKQLMDTFHLRKDRLAPPMRHILLNYFPRFLDNLEEEIFSPNSSIWNVKLKSVPPPHVEAILERKRRGEPEKSASPESPILPHLVIKVGPGTEQTSQSVKREREQSESSKMTDANDGEVKKHKTAPPSQEDPEDVAIDVIEETISQIDNPSNSLSNKIFKDQVLPLEEVIALEKNGTIRLALISNSVTTKVDRQTMLYLFEFQSIVSQQLPNMPVMYISRLVFDPKHKTLVLLKDNKIMGGICFRTFASQGFCEIVFCAVLMLQQYKGYGAHLMNHLKEYHLRINVQHLLTFVDDGAKGYFHKQGFTEDIKLDPSVYQNIIKNYNEATLMHCQLNPKIVYTELFSVLKNQIKIIERLIEQKKLDKVEPGLTCFKEGIVKTLSVENIPGINEIGQKPADRSTRVSHNTKESNHSNNLHQLLHSVLISMRDHKDSGPFRIPVDGKIYKDYYDIIKHPMDLETMAGRLKLGYYSSRRIFIANMQRIFNNCRIYNSSDSPIYHSSILLEKYFQAKMRELSLWD